MNNKKNTYFFLALLILFITIASFITIVEPILDKEEVKDIIEGVAINGDKLNVNYHEQKDLDIELTYGNIYTKLFSITNDNKEDVIYGIKFSDATITNDELIYDICLSYDGNNYIEADKNKRLIPNTYLIYNLVISSNSTNYIKIVIKSLHENEATKINGKVIVTDNLSSLDLFNLTINNINQALDDKISKLNGISTKGYYYINIDELIFTNDANIKGYVLVDADDISDLKYIYTVYNDKYMVKNQNYKELNIINVDNTYINSINENKICNQYDSRVKCSNLLSLPKNKTNNKLDFYNNSKKLLRTFLEEYNKDDDKTYIYDVTKDITNDTKLTGYILKNNKDLFIYLQDGLFMISGYNYSKLGDYNLNSKTIRSYNETAFNLSAKDKKTVCSFSLYDECYDINNNRIE